MGHSGRTRVVTLTPAAQLRQFMARYDPAIARRARLVLAKMRAQLPGAIELVYDNYNALVIGFSPSERPSDAVFSVVLYPRWVTLFFLQGAGLPDPAGLLRGSGHIVRHLVVDDEAMLDRAEVRALVAVALRDAGVPVWRRAKRRLIIRSVAPKQRARRPRPR